MCLRTRPSCAMRSCFARVRESERKRYNRGRERSARERERVCVYVCESIHSSVHSSVRDRELNTHRYRRQRPQGQTLSLTPLSLSLSLSLPPSLPPSLSVLKTLTDAVGPNDKVKLKTLSIFKQQFYATVTCSCAFRRPFSFFQTPIPCAPCTQPHQPIPPSHRACSANIRKYASTAQMERAREQEKRV